jgi:hypothetical protein
MDCNDAAEAGSAVKDLNRVVSTECNLAPGLAGLYRRVPAVY